MKNLKHVILENKAWVAERMQINANYFSEISKDQAPHYLWIGCSDSRVNPNEITGTGLGDMFVHRNIANLVNADDLNLMSVIAYGVEYLHIKHLIICGHYGCGGVKSALSDASFGIIDKWLVPIKNLIQRNKKDLTDISDENARVNRLVEMNVIEQSRRLAQVDMIKKALHERDVVIHGWVYDLNTGHLKDLVIIDKLSQ